MPYPIVDGDIFRVVVACTLQQQTGLNDFLFQCTVVGSPTVYDTELASGLSAIFAPLWKGLMADVARYEGVFVRKITGVGPQPRTKFSNMGNGLGTVNSTPLPKQVSGLLSLYTPYGGRSRQGRAYIPFPAETDNEADSTPSPGYLVGLTDIGDVLDQGQLIMGTVGNLTASAGLYPVGGTFYRFDSYKANNAWATQRRRSDFAARNRFT